MVELSLDGVVLDANDNFCAIMGFEHGALVGQKHAALCGPRLRSSVVYQQFWADLRAGKFFGGRFKRRHRSGRVIWLEATYNPVLEGDSGRVTKVVKFAADVTVQVERRKSA